MAGMGDRGAEKAREDQQHLGLEDAKPGIFARPYREQQSAGQYRKAQTVAAMGDRTRLNIAAGISRQKPSRRIASGVAEPTSKAIPNTCAPLSAA